VTADEGDPCLEADEKLLQLKAEYESQATPLDRAFARATRVLALPSVSIAIAVAALVWTVANAAAPHLGWRPLDPPPFQSLQVVGTVVAVVIATLILAGQRREDEAERRRSQLTLHLAAQSEHKIAKLIALLEEQRRENPLLPDRADPVADRMARPSEPREVLDRLDVAPTP